MKGCENENKSEAIIRGFFFEVEKYLHVQRECPSFYKEVHISNFLGKHGPFGIIFQTLVNETKSIVVAKIHPVGF